MGNSSAGVREAPVYGVPTCNIVTRQNKRFDYQSIINVSENRAKILEVLHKLPKKISPSKHFGKGNSAELFIQILKRKSFWNRSCQKTFRDIQQLKFPRTNTAAFARKNSSQTAYTASNQTIQYLIEFSILSRIQLTESKFSQHRFSPKGI